MSKLKCPTCGGPVLAGGKGDGTHWYEPAPDPAVARLVEAAQFYRQFVPVERREEGGYPRWIREGLAKAEAALAPFRSININETDRELINRARKEAGK